MSRGRLPDQAHRVGDFILAIVADPGTETELARYVRRPFDDCGVTTDFNGVSVNFPLADLLAKATEPS